MAALAGRSSLSVARGARLPVQVAGVCGWVSTALLSLLVNYVAAPSSGSGSRLWQHMWVAAGSARGSGGALAARPGHGGARAGWDHGRSFSWASPRRWHSQFPAAAARAPVPRLASPLNTKRRQRTGTLGLNSRSLKFHIKCCTNRIFWVLVLFCTEWFQQ